MLSPIWGFIQHWAPYGRVVQELSCLSDCELTDIGFSRHQPYSEGTITLVSLGRLRALSAPGNFG